MTSNKSISGQFNQESFLIKFPPPKKKERESYDPLVGSMNFPKSFFTVTKFIFKNDNNNNRSFQRSKMEPKRQ